MSSAVRLQDQEVRALTTDARIVAIRWDVLEWAVVLDLDVPVSEARDAPMRRAWLAFPGVSEITLAMREARVPTGIWLTSSLEARPDEGAFQVFSCHALLPVFDGTTPRFTEDASTLLVRAHAVLGVVSRGSQLPGELGLTYESRQALCPDRELRSALDQVR